jgi:hypothetical protein
VEIDNQNFNDMKIYLVDAGSRVYIGIAPGLSRASLAVPRGASRSSIQLRLLADPIGGESAITTENLFVAPGQNVFWAIGSFPTNSFVSALSDVAAATPTSDTRDSVAVCCSPISTGGTWRASAVASLPWWWPRGSTAAPTSASTHPLE